MRQITATFLAALMVASAQQTPPQPGLAKSAAKFDVTTQLVVVDVFAKDKNGNAIEGLKASDFTVTEDGKAQPIKVFVYQRLEEQAAPALPEPPPALKEREPANAVKSVEASVKPVTNNLIAPAKAGEVKYKDKRLMVMFFDLIGMPIPDQMRAQTAALKFIKTQMTPSDLMAVMTYSSDLKVVEDFTDDRDQLTKDVKSLMIGEGSDMTNTTADDSTADEGAAFTQDDTEFNIFNTDRQLAALESAVKMLASLSEKKALVYFASGMSKTGVDNEAQLRATINAAIRSNVAFYPIDTRGLVANAPLGDATKGASGSQGMYSGSSARAVVSNFQSQQETLFTLAADTGGKALLDNNDLALGIVQAQKDISSYYVIGYNSTNTALDGHFRRIKVQINNNLSAKLDYRTGYFASKEFKKFDSSDKERQLQEALMLGDPMTDIGGAMEIDYFRLSRDSYAIPIVVKIPGSDLELARHGGADTTRLDFIGEAKNAKGEVKQNVRDTIPVTLKGQTAGELAKRTLAYDTAFYLPPGKYSIKFLVRDNETGKMGTYEQNYTVPDLTAEQVRLPISSVILSNQRESVNSAVYTAEKDKKVLAANPLVQNNQRLVPSVTRVFKKDKDLYVFLETYEPTATTTQPIVAKVGFYRNKVKAFETEPLVVSEGLDAKSKALPVRFSVPLAKLQPGKYECQVTVLNPEEKKSTFWRAQMVVVP